jgi:hypothetical protein
MMHRRIRDSPRLLLVLVAGGLVLFELLHRVIGVAQAVSSIVLGLFFLPILVIGTVGTITLVLQDPEGLGHAIRYTFAFLSLTVVFFAVLFAELGVMNNVSGRETHDFWTGLYFSVSTLTTLGYGDVFPMPESRMVAAIEALTGYVLLGLVVATAFTHLSHRSVGRRR